MGKNLKGLTDRQLEVIKTISEKKLYKREEIANALGISTTTVLTHLNAIYNKINEDRIAGIVDFYWSELKAK
jgi:DNA-binding CsgD family transcriptional regulator